MPPTEREIYPNAPLEFVVCELRYPLAPALGDDALLPRLHRAFRDWLPIVEAGVETTLVFGSGPAAPPAATRQFRFMNRDRTLSVLVTPTLVSVESTDYSRYEDLRVFVSRAIDALNQIDARIVGLTRIGLRYIDEVRVSAQAEVAWGDYIDEKLSAPLSLTLSGHRPALTQGTAQFELGAARHVVMRYGAQVGQAVGNIPLRRRRADHLGAFFLIDIDSYWADEDPSVEFKPDAALQICDDLHGPVRQLFEASITERLRNEELRRVEDAG